MSDNHSSWFDGVMNTYGFVSSVVNRAHTRKQLKKINQANQANQGITYYQPSMIEAFFYDNEPLGNMAFSGGSNEIRSRAVQRAVECALLNQYGVVVIHIGNSILESTLFNCFNTFMVSINPGNPVYDPFIGLNNNDIVRLISSSSQKGFEIQNQGSYYIEGMCDYLRLKRIQTSGDMLTKCPFATLVDYVNAAETKGEITAQSARTVLSKIMQGDSEKGKIQHFFNTFGVQSNRILAGQSNQHQAVNIRQSVQQGILVAIDVISSTNDVLINVIVNEIQLLLSQGHKMMLVVDSIDATSSNSFQELLRRSGVSIPIVLSADDVFSLFSADNEFFSFIGKSTKIVVSKHSSAVSAQKWADVIGSYDKIEVNSTYSQNTGYYGRFAVGGASSIGTGMRRENIVKPEEICRMSRENVYVISKANSELASFQVI